MRHNPRHASDDPSLVRDLVRRHPWTTIVSTGPEGLVASHYPVLLEDTAGDADDLVALTHVGRPDERLHGFGSGAESLLVFQGHHGYVSPSWYEPGTSPAPTWNFTAVHAYGVPEVLDADENLAVLTRLVAHFEQAVDEPMPLDPDRGRRLALGTVGLRIPISRFTAKVKMSQDKDERSVQNVIDALRRPGPYHHPDLAEDMETTRARGIGYA